MGCHPKPIDEFSYFSEGLLHHQLDKLCQMWRLEDTFFERRWESSKQESSKQESNWCTKDQAAEVHQGQSWAFSFTRIHIDGTILDAD